MAVLTLSELRDITHAFDGFVTIEESNLPEYYKEVFPHHCKCGGEIILTLDNSEQGGYTQLQCCNPDCWIKMAHRFAYFCKTLGFKGFGPASALTLFQAEHETFKYPTFLCIFDTPLSEVSRLCGDAFANDFDELKTALNSGAYQFQDAIAALGIPDIGKGCKLFDIIKSPVALLDFILKDRIEELCEAAGIYAPKSRFYLEIHKIDVLTLMADIMPNIKSTPKHDVCVAITGQVSVNSQPLTRSQFIAMCESLQDKNGNQAYKLVETKAMSKLEYVIADAPSSSSKYSLGKQLGILITAQEFYDRLVEGIKVPSTEEATEGTDTGTDSDMRQEELADGPTA